MNVKRKVSGFVHLFIFFLMIFIIPFLPRTSLAEQKITNVAKDVFTITQGSTVDSNTTFIVSDEGVLVIDTRPNPDEALKVLWEIRKVTSKPIKYVINTHFHGDHVFGNQIFAEASAIIAHKNVRLFLDGKTGEEHLAFLKKMGIPGLEEARIIVPNISYHKGLDIIFGKFNLEIKHLGKGHTDSDTIIYIPEEKILIAGDLVFNRKIPFAGHAYISEWIKRLEELERFDADIVIPGHGDIGDKTIINTMKKYLSELKSAVMEHVARRKSLEDTKGKVKKVMEKYKIWKNFDWLDGNIERAYQELSKQ